MPKAQILSGKDTAHSVYNKLNERIVSLGDRGIRPGLCVVLVGDDPASKFMLELKPKSLNRLGYFLRLFSFQVMKVKKK